MKAELHISPLSEWAVVGLLMLIFAVICFCCGYKSKLNQAATIAHQPETAANHL